MNAQERATGKALAAEDAGVWLLLGVRALVDGEVALTREGFAAGGARVRPLPGVCALVQGEAGGVRDCRRCCTGTAPPVCVRW